MNLRLLLFPVLSFAAGAAALVCYRLGSGESVRGSALPGQSASAARALGEAPGGVRTWSAAGGASDSTETLGFAGLRNRPTLDDLFNATGMDRPLRIAIFLQTASSADLALLTARARKEWTYDTSLTDQIWLRWVEIDREAAFKADGTATAVWWAWAKLDPQAAVAAAAAASPRNLEEVIRSIGQGDQDAAIQLIAQFPAADTPLVWEGILNGMGKTDRGAAAALALEKNVKLDEHVGDWVAREPDAAMAWARGLEDPVQRRRVMDLAVKELISSDPRAAMDELERLPAGRSRTERTAEAIAALARTDPAAARAAAGALPNPADRQRALSDLTETLAARDPAAALTILKELSWAIPVGWTYKSSKVSSSGGVSDGQDYQLQSIRQLMQSAPEATANLLAALPSERKAPVFQAVRQWAGHQPEAASRWIQAMPAGESKDTAISALNHWLTQDSPEPDFAAALAWGAAVSSPEQQFIFMQNTLSNWRNQDWKAARAAVDRLTLTPGQREQVLLNFGGSPQNP